MTIDPQIQWVLDLIRESPYPPVYTLAPPAARAQYDETATKLDIEAAKMDSVVEIAIGRESRFVRTRLYTPEVTGQPTPLLVWIHGGGWTIGSLDSHDRTCRGLARDAFCKVLSVDYALAPENPFPAAIEDVMVVWNNIHASAADYGIDPERIAVGGDSAGGNLSAVLCHEAQKAGLPMPCFQLLIYPATDMAGTYASMTDYAYGYLLEKPHMNWFGEGYRGDADPADPRLSPLLNDDFEGLPPAAVYTAGFDPLQDEGIAYARKLEEAGVPVIARHYPGLIHGYFNMGGAVKAAKIAFDDAASDLRQALHPSG
ncbi:MAG: alpha/beta hydrolase [Rhodospirillaceae bacterium]|nr:alpha/beta hydrolase [Rhodospirillaceae bacterium]